MIKQRPPKPPPPSKLSSKLYTKKMNIQPIGIYFPQDQEGHVLNPTRMELIPAHWRPLLEEVQEQYRIRLGESLHSIWLRGSVARGTAVDGVSDLDSFALVLDKPEICWQSADWEAEVARALRQKYSFVGQIEFQLNSYVEYFAHAFPRISMIVKTQSLHLWGADIRSKLPDYHPGRDMCLYYRWIAGDVADYLQKPAISIDEWRSLLKTFIRAGFELVMEREQRFTLDLFCCVEAFSRHYAEKSGEMQLALQYFVEPPPSLRQKRRFVEKLGRWLEKEVKKCFPSGNDS